MLACLYDVHGNLPALEAVLADARAAGTEQWIFGGDLAVMGAWPLECVDMLREVEGPALWVRGNTERWLVETPEDEVNAAAVEFARAEVGPTWVTILSALPPDARYGEDTLVCHASPGDDMRGISPEPSDSDEVFAALPKGRIVFGHTHVQFQRHAHAVDLVNPGSVGMPFDGDHRAAYALIGDDGAVDLRRVEYDHESAAARAESWGEVWSPVAAARIRGARYVV